MKGFQVSKYRTPLSHNSSKKVQSDSKKTHIKISVGNTDLSRTHLWHLEPPYVLDTVFKRLVILDRSIGRDGVI